MSFTLNVENFGLMLTKFIILKRKEKNLSFLDNNFTKIRKMVQCIQPEKEYFKQNQKSSTVEYEI